MGDPGTHDSTIVHCTLTGGESGDNSTALDSCEHCNEFSGSAKGMQLPDQLLKNDSDPRS
jgi:hypothetical protein